MLFYRMPSFENHMVFLLTKVQYFLKITVLPNLHRYAKRTSVFVP